MSIGFELKDLVRILVQSPLSIAGYPLEDTLYGENDTRLLSYYAYFT